MRIQLKIGMFLREDRANVAMVFALGTPMLVGAAAFTVETSYDYWKHTHLQAVADAASYAGALENRTGAPYSEVEAAAIAAAKENGWTEEGNTIEVNTPPTSGSNMNNQAVEVKITENVPRFFSAIYNSTPINAAARSVAIYRTDSDACILALNKTAAKAIEITGSANVGLSGCDIASNSNHPTESMYVWGNSRLSADCAIASGGLATKGNITVKKCKGVITNAPRIGDPFKTLEAPPAGPVRTVPNGNGAKTLQPGTYNGMDLKGDVTLQPGIYTVNGDLKIAANGNLNGSGVMFYLPPGGNVKVTGTPALNLSAPTSGDYEGILFFGDRDGSGDNKFSGNSTSHLTGNLYFPSQKVTYIGNFSGNGGCTFVVADMITMNGSANFGVNCPDPDWKPPPGLQYVKIVE